MNLCAAYHMWIHSESFDQNQSQWEQYQQRREKHVNAGRSKHRDEPSTKEPVEVLKRISQCDSSVKGQHEYDHPLRCDCSYQGDEAGFPHGSYFFEFAHQMSRQWDGVNLNELRRPWEVCNKCNQPYEDELAIDLANKFVFFVNEAYPNDQEIELEALSLKLGALWSTDTTNPSRKEETTQIARRIVSIIEKIRTIGSDTAGLPVQIQCHEIFAYNILGCIALLERDDATSKRGSRAAAVAAAGYFEKCRCISKAIGDVDWIETAEENLDLAKSNFSL
mmetsp:Transcript_8003/g.12697  ORF Transcript_8003/g.12697 Transcript_8003/m.12697 type:complete len:278 (+) Transcript_8003:58-891(+)